MPSLPFGRKALVIVVRNYAKADTKIICCCPVLLDFFTFFKYTFSKCPLFWVLPRDKYGVFPGPNTEKFGPEKTPYLDNFHTVEVEMEQLTACKTQFSSAVYSHSNLHYKQR